MWTVQAKLNSGKTYPYGFGWYLADVNGHRLMYHTGGNQGFFVNISRYVDDRLTIIVMNNLDEDHCDTLTNFRGDSFHLYSGDQRKESD